MGVQTKLTMMGGVLIAKKEKMKKGFGCKWEEESQAITRNLCIGGNGI